MRSIAHVHISTHPPKVGKLLNIKEKNPTVNTHETVIFSIDFIVVSQYLIGSPKKSNEEKIEAFLDEICLHFYCKLQWNIILGDWKYRNKLQFLIFQTD